MSAKASSQKLGRGFDTLLPQNFDTSLLTDEHDRIQHIVLDKLEANPDQPRRHFDQNELEQLALSLKQYGVLQPLIVTTANDGKYRIIAGERRWRAAEKAKLKTIPVIIRSSKELEQLEIALVENVQRVDLSPLEQAASIERLHDQFNLSYETISERLGKASSTVHNIARLLQLPASAQKALHEKQLTEGHARAILALKGFEKEQEALLNQIKQHGWSVRQAERFVTAFKEGYRGTKQAKVRVKTETPETRKLSERLKTPVTIRRTAKGGKLEIQFKSDQELTQIVRSLIR